MMTDKKELVSPAINDRRELVDKVGAGTAGFPTAGSAPYAFS